MANGYAANFVAQDKCSLENSSYDPTTNDFCLSFWLYLNSFTAESVQVICGTAGYSNTKYGFAIDILNSTGILRFRINNAAVGAYQLSTLANAGVIQTGVWQHVIIAADRDGDATCWVNNVEQLSPSIASFSATLGSSYALKIDV